MDGNKRFVGSKLGYNNVELFLNDVTAIELIEIFTDSIDDVLEVLRIADTSLTVIVDHEVEVFTMLMSDLAGLSRATKDQYLLLIELIKQNRLVFKQANVVSGTEYLVLNNKAFKNVEIKSGRHDWNPQTGLTQKQLLNKAAKAEAINHGELINSLNQLVPYFNQLDTADQVTNLTVTTRLINSKKYNYTSSIVFTNGEQYNELSSKLLEAKEDEQTYQKLIEPFTSQIKKNEEAHLLKLIVGYSRVNTTKLLFNTPIYIIKVSFK